MEDKLNFSLPETKKKNSLVSTISFILLLVIVFLTSAILVIQQHSPINALYKESIQTLSAEQTKELAMKLAQRNLYLQAADVWKQYLASAELTESERAVTLFEIAKLLEKQGNFAEAVEYFYRSEMTSKIKDLQGQISSHVQDCLEKLGRFSALRYELMDRTAIDKSTQQGSKIVAEIGSEKITESELDAAIEAAIENQLAPMASFMTTEQLNEQKQSILKQYMNSQSKLQFLQSWLMQEVLYRQALEEKFQDDPEVKKLLDEMTRGVLGQQLMNEQLASKINITETDLETYYQANKETYIEPAKAKIRHIRAEKEELANELLERLKAGEDFGKLAQEYSIDQSTKDKGGKIDDDVTEDTYVAGIGEAKELNKEIFTASAPALLDDVFKTENGWEVVEVMSKTQKRQKSFDEVRQQVMSELASKKRREVQQQYIDQMMDKYSVIIHRSVFGIDESQE